MTGNNNINNNDNNSDDNNGTAWEMCQFMQVLCDAVMA